MAAISLGECVGRLRRVTVAIAIAGERDLWPAETRRSPDWPPRRPAGAATPTLRRVPRSRAACARRVAPRRNVARGRGMSHHFRAAGGGVFSSDSTLAPFSGIRAETRCQSANRRPAISVSNNPIAQPDQPRDQRHRAGGPRRIGQDLQNVGAEFAAADFADLFERFGAAGQADARDEFGRIGERDCRPADEFPLARLQERTVRSRAVHAEAGFERVGPRPDEIGRHCRFPFGSGRHDDQRRRAVSRLVRTIGIEFDRGDGVLAGAFDSQKDVIGTHGAQQPAYVRDQEIVELVPATELTASSRRRAPWSVRRPGPIRGTKRPTRGPGTRQPR